MLYTFWMEWAYFATTGKVWSTADDWRVMYEVIRPFKQFDGIYGC